MGSLAKGESKGFSCSGMFRHDVSGTVRESTVGGPAGDSEVNQVLVRDAYNVGGEMSCQG